MESDLSVLHRVDDPADLDGPRFLRLIGQLPRYDGALRAALLQTIQEEGGGPDYSAFGAPQGARQINDVHQLAATVPGIEVAGS